MANQQYTFWQKLFHRVSGGASKQVSQKSIQLGLDQLQNIDPNEYNVKKMEMQQTLYIQSQWKKIDNELYQKAVFYEPTRIAAYYDYESMEFTPEISATLDIYMEESTTADDKGEILTINSDSNKIRMELYDLFYNRLDINSNLAPWIRNTVKYGDNFVYLKVLPEQGVIGTLQLPNIEITRLEPTFQKVAHYDNTFQSPKLAFYWKNKDLEFSTFEVAHFRLLGDDRRLPYGTSILEKARRIWKQLLLAEDAMLVYRVSRAPERRVYKVYVGNMDDEDIEAYVQKVANEFKRTQMVDEANGNVDLRYNQLAVDQDFFIPVRDPNASNPIETLPGAQNLSEIADIEYIQQKLFAALRVPKAFLGFEDAFGDGKNLALLDIRFARAIHRVQKSIIQELNKIAQIHLIAKGYEDDVTNFELALNTPSTQSDILKLERWAQKINLYRDVVSDAGNGFGAMSMTRAQKEILDMSEEEIKLDVQRQVVERAAREEAQVLAELIKQSGIFNDIYTIYNINPNDLDYTNDGGEEREDDVPAGDFGGGGGGLDLGDDNEFGDDVGEDDFEALGDDEELNENKIPKEVLKNFPFDNKKSMKESYKKIRKEQEDKKDQLAEGLFTDIRDWVDEMKKDWKDDKK